jgi:hypothetical protein
MATFRCRQPGSASLRRFSFARLRRSVGLLALVSLACAPRESTPPQGAATADIALIQKLQIDHVTPRPDFVGPTPAKLEWTAVAGADSYAVGVENEIEIPVFDQDGIKTTSIPWPKEVRVEPGTYYWRITGMKGGKIIADSGRAAFVVMEP